MTSGVIFDSRRLERRSPYLYLASFWLAGFVSGILFSLHADSLAALQGVFFLRRQTVAGLTVVLIFPLLISVLLLRKPVLLYIVSFTKSFCLGCSSGYVLTFSLASGWLISFLFLFSDTLFQPWLYFFWASHLDGNQEKLVKHIAVCSLAAVTIGLVDLFFISPFLMTLFNY